MARPNATGEEVFYIRFWDATDVGFEMRGFEIFQLDSPFFWGVGFMLGFIILVLEFSLFVIDFQYLCSVFSVL